MLRIASLSALEILDSRGRPTVQATCRLESGALAMASVPSGASTGAAEAVELRDGDPARYRGLGCRNAVANILGPIASAICHRDFTTQRDLDRRLIALDGTDNKSRLGANALLAVSIACARAVAIERGIPLYRHIAELAGRIAGPLPRLTVNLFSGGKHAGGQAPVQDVLVVPASAQTIDAALSTTFAIYQAAADLCAAKYRMRLLRADEGGLAPPFAHAESMFEDAIAAIENAGLNPGRDVCLAVDVAASHFYDGAAGRYALNGARLSSVEMVNTLERWVAAYPIVSVEDGLAEEDWAHWPLLVEKLRGRALVVGDDLLCTDPGRIRRAIESRAATALLLKVNQVGTLSEALEARELAGAAGWQTTVSARSGETEDSWLADLAVGIGGEQIKVGSITQSERLAKYNRLLAIEAETELTVAPWPHPAGQIPGGNQT